MREAAGPGRPTAAGVCDFLAGGHDHFAADRELAGQLLALHPGVRQLARVNRGFVLAAARRAGERGVRQFIDLGCGMRATPALHDLAREGNPAARVVYVDRDAAVISHAETACWAGGGLGAVLADVSDVSAVLAAAGMLGLLDFAEPAAIVLGGTLSAMPADEARTVVAAYMAEMAPGSCAVISCASYEDADLGAQMAAMYSAAGDWLNHSPRDVAGFFGGLRVEGGQARDVQCWSWPDLQEPIVGAAVIGGIGIRD